MLRAKLVTEIPDLFSNAYVYVDVLQSATDKQRHVNTSDRMWARLLSSTHQPNFLRYNKVIEEQRERNVANQAVNSDNDLFGLTASHSIAMAPQSKLKKGYSNVSSARVCIPSTHIFSFLFLFSLMIIVLQCAEREP